MDPHSIGRLDPDPDPGGLKRYKMKEETPAKRQIISHEKYKNHCNLYKNVYCDFIFIKIKFHFQSWIRIRIKSMRIRNTG
jgi:hypothetical protein